MSVATIILIILAALFVLALIAALVLAFYVWITIRDIKELLATMTDVRELLMRKQYAAILSQPRVREQIMQLIANRFGFLAPIGMWVLRKLFARYIGQQPKP